MDYATFCGADMEPFECNCGAAACRGVIRGTDHLDPRIRAAYGTRMSDYVWARRWLRKGLTLCLKHAFHETSVPILRISTPFRRTQMLIVTPPK